MTCIIYKIYCKDSEIKDCYVGSTEDFEKRCISHNTCCHNENDAKYNYKVYKFIREHGGMSCWIIEEIIKCDEDTRYDAEVHYFKLLNSTLNTRFPRRTRKQYRIDNKEKLAEINKQYRIDNDIKIQCGCGSVVSKRDISTHCRTQKHKRYLETIE
jgi:predicted GIY-YIG superfamily endonuclease